MNERFKEFVRRTKVVFHQLMMDPKYNQCSTRELCRLTWEVVSHEFDVEDDIKYQECFDQTIDKLKLVK